jgi:hypothetical protein
MSRDEDDNQDELDELKQLLSEAEEEMMNSEFVTLMFSKEETSSLIECLSTSAKALELLAIESLKKGDTTTFTTLDTKSKLCAMFAQKVYDMFEVGDPISDSIN